MSGGWSVYSSGIFFARIKKDTVISVIYRIAGKEMLLMEQPDTKHGEHTDQYDHTSHVRLKAAEYFRQVKAHLLADRKKEAFALLQQSMTHFPNNPILLSYYGWLMVLVDRRYRAGIETCMKALVKLRTTGSFDEDTYYQVCYYNLGRAYAAAGKRKEALDALKRGWAYGQWNTVIVKEMQQMGIRREKPPIPFLKRSNLLNRYIGIILHRKNHTAIAKKRAHAC